MEGDILKPAEPDSAAESLHEHLELAHYIDVFRLSAERVRRLVFIIMVFSVVMLVAQWNTADTSWVMRRYKGYEELFVKVKDFPAKAADEAVQEATDDRLATREELKGYIDSLLHERLDKVIFVEIPGLGVTFDINDLGNFCGIAYLLLLSLLVFSLMREHENLYLAMFKVRRLHDHRKSKSDGESTANYLYHALAMSQVLNSPPTLAQWAPSWVKTEVLNAIFLVPALVQGYIIFINWRTLSLVRIFNADTTILLPEFIFLMISLALGLLALQYSRSCNRRWKNAFLYINPSLRRVRSRPWSLWLGWRKSKNPIHRRMWTQAIESLSIVKNDDEESRIEASHTLLLDGSDITYPDIIRMFKELEEKAVEKASEAGTPYPIIRGKVDSSVLNGNVWEVSASFFARSKAAGGLGQKGKELV